MSSVSDNIIWNKSEYGAPSRWEKEFLNGYMWGITPWLTDKIEKTLLPHRQPPWGRVLEIGCGYGRLADFLLKDATTYTGIDLNKCCVDSCIDKYPSARFLITEGNNVPVGEEKFDLIVSWDSLTVMDEAIVQSYLREVKRLLSPSGIAWLHYSGGTLNKESVRLYPRSNMTTQGFNEYANSIGLKVISQSFDLQIPTGVYNDTVAMLGHV